MSDPFIGEIRAFAFNYPPMGWFPCDGRLLPIQQYQALFALLGTQFGGNGTTQFQLPNLQGRVAIGVSPGHAFASAGGAETVTLTQNQMPAHQHAVNPAGLQATLKGTDGSADSTTPGGHTLAATDGNTYATGAPENALAAGSVAITGTASCAQTGGSQAHENMPPFTTLNYCIAWQGIFPPRE